MTVALAGATGMVGALALRRLLAAATDVVVLARRPPEVTDPHLRVLTTDFSDLVPLPPVPVRAAISALGTTIKKAGSQDAFRAVDHHAVVAFASWARRGGAQTFVLVSSVGADAGARTFYLRVKGEVERDVAALGFARVVVLRPSMLLGERTESRPGEAVMRVVFPVLNPLLAGPLRRYRGISADAVAAAAVAAAEDAPAGVSIWETDRILSASAPRRT